MDRSAARTQESRKARLAILVNTIAPYRRPIYRYLAQAFDTLVLHGGTEPNRSWKLDASASLKARQVWSVQIPMKRQTGVSGVTDAHYVHFNAGCAAELLDPESLFDPLSEASFDAALEKAISGCVPKGDRDRLRTWQQVGEDIRVSILQRFPVTQAQASSAKGVAAEVVTFA